MDERFLNYYEEELRFVREMACEFASLHPTIAKRLSLDGPECQDPYTERLLEGFAFLTARVRLRMDSGFPAFTETLLNRVMPGLTAPVPSATIVEFDPNLSEGALVEGVRLARGTSLLARAEGSHAACDYRLAHDVVMWPLTIEAASYVERAAEIEAEGPDLHSARAAIRLRISTPGIPLSKLKLDRLSFFLSGRDDLPDRLLQQLLADALAVVIRPAAAGAPSVRLGPSSIVHLGFDDEEALLPQTALGFSGHRLLQEFFMLPRRMCFVAVDGLGQGIKSSQATAFDLFFVLRQPDYSVAQRLDAKTFRLNCAPAINLFPRQADRIRYQPNRAEHAIVVDRSRAHEFEVHTVLSVEGILPGNSRRLKFSPLYASHDPTLGEQPSAYFAVRRERRLIATSPEEEGTETYIGLVNLGTASPEISQLAVDTLCTNRRLPNTLRAGVTFSINEAVPVRAARAIVAPTSPGLPLAGGAASWSLIDLLAFSHSGFTSDANANAAHLRRVLAAFSDASSPDQRRILDSLTRVAVQTVNRRLPGSGPAAFGLGLEFRVLLDSIGLRGIGGFGFAAVLERFLSRSATINSFAETVLENETGETLARWPARLGTHQIV